MLINCPECKKEVSETADKCTSCGFILTPEKIEEIKNISKVEKEKKEKNEKNVAKGCGGCLYVIAAIFILVGLAIGITDRSVNYEDKWINPAIKEWEPFDVSLYNAAALDAALSNEKFPDTIEEWKSKRAIKECIFSIVIGVILAFVGRILYNKYKEKPTESNSPPTT